MNKNRNTIYAIICLLLYTLSFYIYIYLFFYQMTCASKVTRVRERDTNVDGNTIYTIIS